MCYEAFCTTSKLSKNLKNTVKKYLVSLNTDINVVLGKFYLYGESSAPKNCPMTAVHPIEDDCGVVLDLAFIRVELICLVPSRSTATSALLLSKSSTVFSGPPRGESNENWLLCVGKCPFFSLQK